MTSDPSANLSSDSVSANVARVAEAVSEASPEELASNVPAQEPVSAGYADSHWLERPSLSNCESSGSVRSSAWVASALSRSVLWEW